MNNSSFFISIGSSSIRTMNGLLIVVVLANLIVCISCNDNDAPIEVAAGTTTGSHVLLAPEQQQPMDEETTASMEAQDAETSDVDYDNDTLMSGGDVTTKRITSSSTLSSSTRPSKATGSELTSGSCSPLVGNYDSLTQVKFAKKLTNDCRYDRLTIPETDGPQVVYLQINLKHIEAVDQLQFKTHMLVQYSYEDERLAFERISPMRETMVGQELFRGKIWTPHIVLVNEKNTQIMGTYGNDVLISITPKGQVTYSYRMTAYIYCWMDLQKFPFDEQICDITYRSWAHNASQLLLKWDRTNAVDVANQLHLTEFRLVNHWTLESMTPIKQAYNTVGNFSTLIFKFHLSREVGFYLLDYFIPSIMLVCTSWVTFWLQADNAAPRITLGTSTMLSFITLASGQSKTLPKVSYIKASEIWFIGCTIFIFASIAEFAFVNIIWRRKKHVELKKPNAKYILKTTITPKLARRELQRSSSMTNLHKSNSCSNISGSVNNNTSSSSTAFLNPNYNNYLTVHSFPCIPIITTDDNDEGNKTNDATTTVSLSSFAKDKSGDELNNGNNNKPVWTTMTPQEIAMWIDKRSRIVFPCMFIIFNVFYWTFVYVL